MGAGQLRVKVETRKERTAAPAHQNSVFLACKIKPVPFAGSCLNGGERQSHRRTHCRCVTRTLGAWIQMIAGTWILKKVKVNASSDKNYLFCLDRGVFGVLYARPQQKKWKVGQQRRWQVLWRGVGSFVCFFKTCLDLLILILWLQSRYFTGGKMTRQRRYGSSNLLAEKGCETRD